MGCSFNIDDDLNAMYLSDKKKLPDYEREEHEELEVLLESFSKQVEEIVSETGNMDVGDSLGAQSHAYCRLNRATCNQPKR